MLVLLTIYGGLDEDHRRTKGHRKKPQCNSIDCELDCWPLQDGSEKIEKYRLKKKCSDILKYTLKM